MKHATDLTTTPAIINSLNKKELVKPLFVLTKKNFTTIKVTEDIKGIEIYAGNRVIAVHENNDRREVVAQHLSIPQLPNEEAYRDYFEQAFLEIKQMDNGQYTIAEKVRGPGGGSGNGKQEEAVDDDKDAKKKTSNKLTSSEKKKIEKYTEGKGPNGAIEYSGTICNFSRPYLFEACRENPKMALLLIKAGADANKYFYTYSHESKTSSSTSALEMAILKGHKNVVVALIEAGADLDDAFHKALSHSVELASYFIEKGADVNVCDEFGATAFSSICERGYLELAKLVLPKVKNINQANKHGHTPLSTACAGDKRDWIKFLLENGADLKAIPKKIYETFSESMLEFLIINNKNPQLLSNVSEQIVSKILRAIAEELAVTKEIRKAIKTNLIEVFVNSPIILQLCNEADHEAVLARQLLADYIVSKLIKLLKNPAIFDTEEKTLDTDEFKIAIKDILSTWRAENKQQVLEEEKSKKIQEEKLKAEKQEQTEEKRKAEKREQEKLDLEKKKLQLQEKELEIKNSPKTSSPKSNPSAYFPPAPLPPTNIYVPPPQPVNPVNQFQTNMQLATDLMNATANLEQGTAALIDAFKP